MKLIPDLIAEEVISEQTMVHPERKLLFLHDITMHMSEQSKQVYLRRFQHVGIWEKKYQRDLAIFSRDQLLQIIESLNGNVGNSFAVNKRFIFHYMVWYQRTYPEESVNLPAVRSIFPEDLAHDSILATSYFKSFDELDYHVAQTIRMADRPDEMEYATHIVAIYLAWFGVKQANVCDICIKDVSTTQNLIAIPACSKTIELPDTIMDYIRRYAASDGYDTQAKVLIHKTYKDKVHLLRTYRSDRLDVTNLRSMLTRFSELNQGSYKKFNYDKIYWSGIFSRAYHYELDHVPITKHDVPLLERLFDKPLTSPSQVQSLLKRYRKYTSYYFAD